MKTAEINVGEEYGANVGYGAGQRPVRVRVQETRVERQARGGSYSGSTPSRKDGVRVELLEDVSSALGGAHAAGETLVVAPQAIVAPWASVGPERAAADRERTRRNLIVDLLREAVGTDGYDGGVRGALTRSHVQLSLPAAENALRAVGDYGERFDRALGEHDRHLVEAESVPVGWRINNPDWPEGEGPYLVRDDEEEE